MHIHLLCCTWQNEGVYTLYVQTEPVVKAGTDSKISVTLGDWTGRSVWTSNLRNWGIMGPQHGYFERDNTDIFTGLGLCIWSPICRLNLNSDGPEAHHVWFCDYIEVTSTGLIRAAASPFFMCTSGLPPTLLPTSCRLLLTGVRIQTIGNVVLLLWGSPLSMVQSDLDLY